MIKFKGQVIEGMKISYGRVVPNWCDSMAEYYPYISIEYVLNGEIKHLSLKPDSLTYDNKDQVEFIIDNDMKKEHDSILEAEKARLEAETIRLYKDVLVYKGRKIPVGTSGRIFWMGSTQYGTSVGIETIQGQKLFTSIDNVKTLRDK